jgi:hypothetical protein
MKTKRSISFRADGIPGEAATILEPTGCGPDVAQVSDYSMFGVRDIGVRIKLDEMDERGPKVLALLQKYGVEVKSFLYDEYSEEDRQQARLLLVGPASYSDDYISIVPGNGTKYDLTSACPNCETGAKQKSPAYLDELDKKIIRKHRAVLASFYSLIVDGGMRKNLVDAGITGITFGDVRMRLDNKNWTEVARDQVFATHTLPPMRGMPKDEDLPNLCKVCRRGGRRTPPTAYYREEDLIGMQDFNLSWEWVGEFWPEDKEKNRPALRPDPRLLVTPKVMNIFNKAGVKAFSCIPVNVAP